LINILIILLAVASISFAGVLTPGLEEHFRTRGEAEFVPVLIVLAGGIHADAEAVGLERAGLNLAQIHEGLIQRLKPETASAQEAVVASLDVMKNTGLARNIRPFWIANIIAAEMTRAGAALAANTADVLEIGLDVDIQLVPLITSEESATSALPENAAFTSNGIRAIWNRGFYGAGRVVCVLGESLRPQHPALASAQHAGGSAPTESFYNAIPLRTEQYCGDHSNRILSVMCGAVNGDTLGVAPAAQWIAADMFVCGKSRLSTFIESLQWAVDPDGESKTASAIPDAILCPWTWDAVCYGSAPTNITDVFDNAEALGPVLVFAANNSESSDAQCSGPGSFEKILTVGNVDTRSGSPQIHASSARGPSGCDTRTIKPNLVAPGTSILTASPDAPSGYARSTSTAVAAAQVAGAIALIRQEYPHLNAAKIKQCLIQSAVDYGSPGPDATFGHGMMDAAAAATLAGQLIATGELQVVVRYGGVGLADARVVATSGAEVFYAQTNDAGVAKFSLLPAQQHYQIQAGRFGYQSFSLHESVLVPPKKMTDVFVTLSRGFADDAEIDQGWLFGISDDNATGGEWIRAQPVPTFAEGAPVQPAKAFAGARCFVTANGADGAEAGLSDVDGGRTTLRSPEFSLIELNDPVLSFHYWFSNDKGSNRGGDFFRAQISNDGGLSWVNVLNTSASSGDWVGTTIHVQEIIEPTRRMLLQFVAEDQGAGSLVEAAVDDIQITGDPIAPEPPRDLMIDVQFDQVVLSWRASRGATLYKIYVSNQPQAVVKPENFMFSTADTSAVVPLTSIQFDEFYFSVTATN
jgi:subtilisin family serine protease